MCVCVVLVPDDVSPDVTHPNGLAQALGAPASVLLRVCHHRMRLPLIQPAEGESGLTPDHASCSALLFLCVNSSILAHKVQAAWPRWRCEPGYIGL